MELLLKHAVQPARAHALPFRVIFQELLQRREADVYKQVSAEQGPGSVLDPEQYLRKAIDEQEAAYLALERADEHIRNGLSLTPLDDLERACEGADAPLKRILHRLETTALCLSGGGIRSASFSLGVLEGLARFTRMARADEDGGLMDRLDYLSTVSGGGYIGSWMTTWVYRRFHAPGANSWKQAYREVVSALAGQVSGGPDVPASPALTGGDPEPRPIRHLRSYTSYLAPELGLTTDTSALLAIVLRNLLANWVMLLPLALALLSGSRAVGVALIKLQGGAQTLNGALWGNGFWLDVVITVLLIVAASVAGLALPSHYREPEVPATPAHSTPQEAQETQTSAPTGDRKRHAPAEKATGHGRETHDRGSAGHRAQAETVAAKSSVLWKRRLRRWAPTVFLVTVIAAAVLLTVTSTPLTRGSHLDYQAEAVIACIGYGLLSVSLYRAEQVRMTALGSKLQERKGAVAMHNIAAQVSSSTGVQIGRAAAMLAATLFAAGVTTGLLTLLRRFAYQPMLEHGSIGKLQSQAHGALFAMLAVPATVSILLVSTSLYCAVLGVFEQEEDREWWGRSGGILLQLLLGWIVLQALVFYGADLHVKVWTGVAGLVLAALSSYGGFSTATAAAPAQVKTADVRKLASFLGKHDLVLPVLGSVAILLIAVGLTAAEEGLRRFWAPYLQPHPERYSALLVFAGFAMLGLLFNWSININLFSLQGMYRLRLMRAYLGASNVFRRPDPFTNFDPNDSPQEFELPCDPGAPMHLINCTLNLTGTSNTAWRQRKAESFSFTPVACGGWRVGYVPTEDYGSRHNGTSLASAMSISGSAFNPNMGYHTSPLLSLLMTFFNVRLGVWLPNPKWCSVYGKTEAETLRFVSRPGPGFSLAPLIQEALGRANDSKKYVELTDGGHFENLGIYEMVLRRCKLIVVVDAGSDPTYIFEDLGNAIRKVRIDLGIPIEFPSDMKMTEGMSLGNSYCAVARIRYGCVDPGIEHENDVDGTLVYLKPGLTGGEPADIYQYARTHASFPNETTVNQFFNESQFESYRHLGSFAVDRIIRSAPAAAHPKGPKLQPDGTMRNFIQLASNFHASIPGKQASPERQASSPK